MNRLYYGDNLEILRQHIADESVDLVYLDPPFNSNATYNVLFRAPSGERSKAQIEAFDDTWHWNEPAEEAYWQVLKGSNTEAARMLEAMRSFLGENDMMAYLAMMAVRLIELHRALKPTGSLYLHCDPTASHYLKVLLDAVFGPGNFVNEISWKRTTTKSDYMQGAKNWPRIHDILLHYAKDFSHLAVFRQPFSAYRDDYLATKYRHKESDGRLYRLDKLTAPGMGSRGHPTYEFMGVVRPWVYKKEKMERLVGEGRIYQGAPGQIPQYKRYLDEVKGTAIGDVWVDLAPINSMAKERLGYPTQKPVALLERIIAASSNEGDLVLDPFCGCGTTIHAAQKLNRNWIGVDITHLAISLIERRMREAFPGIEYEVVGVPKDFGSAEKLAAQDKHEFQKWAITLIPDAQPWKGGQKGADTGIDGIVYLRTGKAKTDKAIVEVKGGETVGVDFVHKLKSVIEREKALCGLLVALRKPSKQAQTEAASAGFVEVDMGTGTARFPRIQILTIEGLLGGTEHPRLPIVDSTVFKKAKREEKKTQGELGV